MASGGVIAGMIVVGLHMTAIWNYLTLFCSSTTMNKVIYRVFEFHAMKRWTVAMAAAAIAMGYLASQNMIPYMDFGNSPRDMAVSSVFGALIGILMVGIVRRLVFNMSRIKKGKEEL